MDSLSTLVVSAAKLPILNPNEFDLWKMRKEQYFLMTDYSLWEVIINRDSPAPTIVVDGVVQPVTHKSADQKLARRNELKARDAFKTRLAVYKFEGNELAWWKAYKQAKGSDAWLITVTWADFKKLFFLQFFPRAEQERLKRDCWHRANAARNYEILHERDDEDTKRLDKRLPMLLATMRSSMRGMMMTLSDLTRGKRVVIGISRPLNRVVTGTTVIIMTVMDQTGEAVVTTTAATTTTLATTTGVPVIGVTRETGVSSPTDLSILVSSIPWVPLRATPTRSALRVDADTQESVVELLVP
nr:hypothetical protein [Tanacetum cinerariifolium]